MDELQNHINEEADKKFSVLFDHAKVANEHIGLLDTKMAVVEEKVITAVKQNWALLGLSGSGLIAIIVALIELLKK